MLAHDALVGFVGSTDLARSRSFYAGALGLTLVEQTPGADVYDAGGSTLRVTKVDAVTVAPYTVLGWTVGDIDAVVTALARRGLTFERFPGIAQSPAGVWTSPSGDRVAWLRDPDGNLLSLTEPGG